MTPLDLTSIYQQSPEEALRTRADNCLLLLERLQDEIEARRPPMGAPRGDDYDHEDISWADVGDMGRCLNQIAHIAADFMLLLPEEHDHLKV